VSGLASSTTFGRTNLTIVIGLDHLNESFPWGFVVVHTLSDVADFF
jgi:hypothetical protein